MKKRKNKTSPEQLARVRDWETRNPERAQARKDAWAKSPAGKAWLKANQAKKNAARDAWRERKKKEAELRAVVVDRGRPKKEKATGPQNTEATQRGL